MTAWSAYVLTEFPETDPLARITLLEDPDTLLADEEIFSRLAARGYRVVTFRRTIELRYLYETFIRPSSDSRLVVIFRGGEDVEAVVPPDIRGELAARRKSLSMREVFPHLDYGVLSELDRRFVTDLFAQREESRERGGGEEATCEFIFEDFLGTSVTSVRNANDLVEALERVHVAFAITSPKLLGYFRDKIRNKVRFQDAALDGVLTNAAKFREWIQYAWDVRFLNLPKPAVAPAGAPVVWDIDFNDEKVKNAMRRLFQGDVLEMRGDLDLLSKQYDYLAAGRVQGKALLDLSLRDLMKDVPAANASWAHWTRFAREWATFTAVKDARRIPVEKFEESRGVVNGRFGDWLAANYSSLDAIPSATPVMVSHAIRCLAARRKEEKLKKVALIVMDGLAWNQWIPIRQSLEARFALSVSGSFAWIPTLTSVSRQAIFAGKCPSEFADSITTTNKEAALWRQAWQKEGVDPARVHYSRSHGLKDDIDELREKLFTGVDVAGLVVDTVDEAVHGEVFGNAGMHERIRTWLRGGYLQRLLELLVDTLGYTVFVTSDHGNVECRGIGNVNEGVLAEVRGERVRVYENDVLRDQRLAKTPQAAKWTGGGLPDDFKAVLLRGRDAFAANGKTCLAHGGASIEEVVVPFVRVDRKG